MNGLCHQFFACAAFPLYQHRGVGRGNILDEFVDHLHLRILAHETAKLGMGLETTLKITDLLLLNDGPHDNTGSLGQYQAGRIYLLHIAVTGARAGNDQRPKGLIFIVKGNDGLAEYILKFLRYKGGSKQHFFIKGNIRHSMQGSRD